MTKNSTFSVFTSKYWVSASLEFSNLKSLIFASLTIALSTVLNSIYIPIGLNLRISFAFLVIAFGSMVFGPVVGLAAGLVYDLVGYLIMPSSVFFPGYTLSSMLEFLIYGIFLYKCQISVLRIFLSKFIVNFGIHVGLGCLWSKILFNKGYYYFLVKSILKNTIMLPIEVFMIVLTLQVFIPFLEYKGIVPKQRKKYIPLI